MLLATSHDRILYTPDQKKNHIPKGSKEFQQIQKVS